MRAGGFACLAWGRHLHAVFAEEHEPVRSAEKPVPPAQQADAADGEIGGRTEIADGVRARCPVGPDLLRGANLGLDGITGANLHEPQEADGDGRPDGQRNAPVPTPARRSRVPVVAST